ncbi:MAG: hypothetical protein V3V78_00805 [Candidatus Woesearchaeota archaeon]
METFLDIGILNYFSVIFPALLVFVIVYALLEKTKILGENKSLHAIAAIVSAFLVMLSRDIVAIINFGAPWFILVFVFLILLLLIYRMMGATDADLTNMIRTDTMVQWAVFIIGLIIIFASISHIYGQRLLEQAPGEAEGVTVGDVQEREEGVSHKSELRDALFNTKVLGMVLILLIAAFAIGMLSRESI